MKHVAILTESQIEKITLESLSFLTFGFKKRESFLEKINPGDKVFYRLSSGQILGYFSVKKVELYIGSEMADLKKMGIDLGEIRVILIVYIKNLEQLITSPVEIDKRSKKKWVVLD